MSITNPKVMRDFFASRQFYLLRLALWAALAGLWSAGRVAFFVALSANFALSVLASWAKGEMVSGSPLTTLGLHARRRHP
jgi:hypothetical protein